MQTVETVRGKGSLSFTTINRGVSPKVVTSCIFSILIASWYKCIWFGFVQPRWETGFRFAQLPFNSFRASCSGQVAHHKSVVHHDLHHGVGRVSENQKKTNCHKTFDYAQVKDTKLHEKREKPSTKVG